MCNSIDIAACAKNSFVLCKVKQSFVYKNVSGFHLQFYLKSLYWIYQTSRRRHQSRASGVINYAWWHILALCGSHLITEDLITILAELVKYLVKSFGRKHWNDTTHNGYTASKVVVFWSWITQRSPEQLVLRELSHNFVLPRCIRDAVNVSKCLGWHSIF